MLTKFLVVLIYFSSYQCQGLEIDSLNIRHHSETPKESLTSQRKVITRRDADLAIESQSTKPKFFICCKQKKFSENGNSVANSTEPINVPIFPPIYTDALTESIVNPWKHFDIHYEHPCKFGSYPLNPNSPHFDIFNILENGEIFLNNSMFKMRNLMKNNDAYCLSNIMNENGTHSVIRLCKDEEIPKDVSVIYPITMSMSIPFLVATFLVYACLPELRNIHGLTLMAHVACLCAAYICLVVTQFGGGKLIERNSLCTSLAFTTYFFLLATFFWLNVMCFDIWWTFRGFRSLQSNLSGKRKRFIIYSVYAWGCASLLTGICLIMDFVPGIPNNISKPQFGMFACWFHSENLPEDSLELLNSEFTYTRKMLKVHELEDSGREIAESIDKMDFLDYQTDKKVAAIYFYGPAGITIICNLCLFISTAFKIFEHRKNTKLQLEGSDSQCHEENKQWFSLYLKLFIVMGMNWSMEIISWYLSDPNEEKGISLWLIPDLGNTLQGISIFIIFVWKDKVRKLLLKKIGRGNWNSQSTSSTKTDNSTLRAPIPTTVSLPLQDILDLGQEGKLPAGKND